MALLAQHRERFSIHQKQRLPRGYSKISSLPQTHFGLPRDQEAGQAEAEEDVKGLELVHALLQVLAAVEGEAVALQEVLLVFMQRKLLSQHPVSYPLKEAQGVAVEIPAME